MKFISLVLFAFCIIQMKSDKASEVVSFAQSKLKCGFIKGGDGKVLTANLLRELYSKYKDEIKTNLVNHWMGKEVYDSSGLVMKAFEKVGIKIPYNCNSAWSNLKFTERGIISNYPKKKLV